MGRRLDLLKFRKERDLNQKQIAEILGITQNHYSRLETGSINPSFNLIERFKDKFNLSGEETYKLFEKCQ